MSFQEALREQAPPVPAPLDRYVAVLAEYWFSYLLFIPTLLFLVLLLWLPLLRGFWMSLHRWPTIGEATYVGLQNYVFLASWDPFWTSVKVTVLYATSTLFQLLTAMLAALVVVRLDRLKNVISGTFMLPYTMAPVVTGTIWLYLLHPSLGPVFKYLRSLGLLADPIYWRVSGQWALTVVTGIATWTFWPFMFIVFVPTLQNIPQEHYETAKIYGADRVQTFFHVTLPQMKSAIFVAVSIRIVWNLSKISQPLQMTGGGPGFETSVLGILLYRFVNFQGRFGLAFAIGITLLALSLVLASWFILQFERGKTEVDRA